MTEEHSAVPQASPARPDPGAPPLDTFGLLERCMGNASLAVALLEKFETQAREDVLRIEQALAAKDAAQTTMVSHALKGAAGAVSAADVQRTAAIVELAARENRLEAAAACFRYLKSEMDRCLAYLSSARLDVLRRASNPPHTTPPPRPHPTPPAGTNS